MPTSLAAFNKTNFKKIPDASFVTDSDQILQIAVLFDKPMKLVHPESKRKEEFFGAFLTRNSATAGREFCLLLYNISDYWEYLNAMINEVPLTVKKFEEEKITRLPKSLITINDDGEIFEVTVKIDPPARLVNTPDGKPHVYHGVKLTRAAGDANWKKISLISNELDQK